MPIILRDGKEPEFIKAEHGFVLAGMENVKYNEFTLSLDKNDAIFMYTDGVTEAQNEADELFSEDRLIRLFSEKHYGKLKVVDVLCDIQKEISEYTGGIQQSDDITMLMFRR